MMQTKCGLTCKRVLELVQRQPFFKMLQSNIFTVANALCRVCNQICVEMCACFVYIYNLSLSLIIKARLYASTRMQMLLALASISFIAKFSKYLYLGWAINRFYRLTQMCSIRLLVWMKIGFLFNIRRRSPLGSRRTALTAFNFYL